MEFFWVNRIFFLGVILLHLWVRYRENGRGKNSLVATDTVFTCFQSEMKNHTETLVKTVTISRYNCNCPLRIIHIAITAIRK
jgi:predicted transcriptional regulator